MTSIRKVSAYLRAACGVSVLLAVVALAPATASAKEACWQNARRRLERRRDQQPLPDQLLPAGAREHARRRSALLERQRRHQPRALGPRRVAKPRRLERGRRFPATRRCGGRGRRELRHAVRALSDRLPPCSSWAARPASTRRGNGEAPHASVRRTTDDIAQVRNAGRRRSGGRRFRYADCRRGLGREVRDPRRRVAAERSPARSRSALPSSTASVWTSSASRCAGIRSPSGSRATPQTTETAPIAGATLTVS